MPPEQQIQIGICDLCGPVSDAQQVRVHLGHAYPQPDLSVTLCARHRAPLAEVVAQIQRQMLAGIR